MSEIVDARGLACPQPVILTKKALETKNDITVLVDNTTALENVKRFASNSGCSVEVSEETGGIFKLKIVKKPGIDINPITENEITCGIERTSPTSGPVVFVITSDKMGIGNDELGSVLIRSFIHTLTEMEKAPDIMIFYNGGVRLTVEGSEVLHDLKKLEETGVKLLVCGTCINYFGLADKVRAGVISNMYDITDTLFRAGRIVKP